MKIERLSRICGFLFFMVFATKEAVPQLLLAPKILLLFGFEALFAFLFLPILDCWTSSKV